jgi:hypothetical protein
MANGPIPYVDALISVLVNANVAIPIIFATVGSIVAIVKAIGGPDVSLTDVADAIERQLADNDANGKAILAALRARL